MSLPNLPQKDNYRREVRTEWGGINLNENAGDGELVESVNMCSREYPIISTERLNLDESTDDVLIAPFMQDGKLGYVKKNGANSYSLYDPTTGGGLQSLSLTDAQANKLQYARLGERLVIWPLKQVYDFTTHTLSNLEETHTLDDATILIADDEYMFKDSLTSYDVAQPLLTNFRAGDSITVSGLTVHPENNKTVIIDAVERFWIFPSTPGPAVRSQDLVFLPHTFSAIMYRYESDDTLPADSYYFKTEHNIYTFTTTAAIQTPTLDFAGEGATSITSPLDPSLSISVSQNYDGTQTYLAFEDLEQNSIDASGVTLTRSVPDLDFICSNENRVWGCKGDTIYCSKLGDPYNWYAFNGLSTDSWTVETGTDGEFTGCCSYQGYPTFFKEGNAFKVLGDTPQNFTLRRQNVVGVAKGCHHTITEIRGLLYYVSSIGAVRWNGGDYPDIISHALGASVGQAAGNASGGTDGIRYFLELMHTGKYYEDGKPEWGTKDRIFTYDTRFGTWHELEGVTEDREITFAGDGANYYMLGYHGGTDIYALAQPLGTATGNDWRLMFADSTRAYKTALTGSESKKGVLRLLIRCKLAGSMKVWIAYDGGEFEQAAEFDDGLPKTSRVVPLILRRCDFWQLRLTGTGDAVIYSIAVEKYGGEWQQA